MALSILQNLTLLISITVIQSFITRFLKGKPTQVAVVNGLLFGGTAILAMLSTFVFSNGIIYDGRTIILGAAGLFGGPVTGLISAAMAVAFRLFAVGGPGFPAGAMSIVSAAGIGILLNTHYERRKATPSWKDFILAAYLIHLAMLASQLLLPGGRWREVLPAIAPVVLTLYPASFVIIGVIFKDNQERAAKTAQLEESEARYRLLFNNGHDIMFVIDVETMAIVDANPASEHFYGWTKDQLSSMPLAQINVDPEASIQARIRDAVESKRSVFVTKHRKASGEIRDVEVYSGPLQFKGKTYLYSIVHDITERLESERDAVLQKELLERTVRRRTMELEEAYRDLESFSYSVSHDLRTPLRAIRGYTSILEEEEKSSLSERSSYYIDRIKSNSTLMGELIESLMKLSRVGQQNLDFSRVDLSQLAREILSGLHAEEPNREVSEVIGENIAVRADKSMMRILLKNLLDNAWKFTADAAPGVIEFYEKRERGERVFVVADNGVGFDMAEAGRLFVPFQRLHEDKSYGGTGIGLSIVKRVVLRHEGKIWVDSTPGKGTRFSFTLKEEMR